MFVNQLESRITEAQFSAEPLADEILADTRSAARVGAGHLDDEDPRRARMLISGLGEHALAALSETPPAPKSENEAWILWALAAGLKEFRKQIAEIIDSMLEMKVQSTLDPELRVCDDAYRWAHRLASVAMKTKAEPNFDTSPEISEVTRDERIGEFRNSQTWRRILHGF